LEARRHFAFGERLGSITMTIRMFFTILAVLSFLFGICFALAPGSVLAIYGIEHSPALKLVGLLLGGALLTLGVILWLARDFLDEAAIRAVLAGTFIGSSVNLIVALKGTLFGTTNALGWSTVLIYLFAAVGSGLLMARTARLAHT
jgi:hypothetical protein